MAEDLFVLAGLSALLSLVAVWAAFASLLPFAGADFLKADVRRHGVSYILAPCILGFTILLVAEQWVAAMAILLTLGALIDRNIAYAPDGIVIPLLVLATWHSPLLEENAWWLRLAVAGGLYWVADLLWSLQVRFGRQFITPADVLSLVTPYLCFGLTLPYLAFNPALAISLILLKSFPSLRVLISRQSAVGDAIGDTQMDEAAPALTLLTVSYPILLVLLILQSLI